MSDLRQCSREFLQEFLELYRNLPCLWQIKSKEYRDRERKKEAYGMLIEKYKEIDKEATRDTVTKKINSLRTIYRKELTKVRQVQARGDGSVYRPSLWYYHLLDFLYDQESPAIESTSSMVTMADDSVNYSDSIMVKVEDISDAHDSELPSTPSSYQSSSPRKEYAPSELPKKRRATMSTSVMPSVPEKVRVIKPGDEFGQFGNYVADKLRNIDVYQAKFAEKLISEVLFEADMGSLNRSWKLMNVDELHY